MDLMKLLNQRVNEIGALEANIMDLKAQIAQMEEQKKTAHAALSDLKRIYLEAQKQDDASKAAPADPVS